MSSTKILEKIESIIRSSTGVALFFYAVSSCSMMVKIIGNNVITYALFILDQLYWPALGLNNHIHVKHPCEECNVINHPFLTSTAIWLNCFVVRVLVITSSRNVWRYYLFVVKFHLIFVSKRGSRSKSHWSRVLRWNIHKHNFNLKRFAIKDVLVL